MARRVSWTNNSSGHSGTYVYRAPTLDPQALPAPVATVDPVAQGATAEWVDSESLSAGDYDYAVQDFDGSGVGALSSLAAHNVPASLSTAQVGDYVGGGVYAGIDTIDGADFHIIAGKSASEAYGLQWKTSNTTTAGTTSNTDGLANTNAMIAAGAADHPAAQHCVNYTGGGFSDWHMPALSQWTLMGSTLADHPEFADNSSSIEFTWASTEYSSTGAWLFRFVDAYEYGSPNTKNDTNRRTRPIRRVAV